jgi:hypothetical protein
MRLIWWAYDVQPTDANVKMILSNDQADGTIRDLAALRGTYRIIPETRKAVEILFGALKEMEVSKVNILLDEPVSNSGRLKALIAEMGESFPFEVDIQVLKQVDRELWTKENVITSDSVIIDHCRSWVNLMKKCVEKYGADLIQVWDCENRRR